MSAPYPNATILAHPVLSATAAARVCHENNLQITQDGRGHIEFAPKSASTVIIPLCPCNAGQEVA